VQYKGGVYSVYSLPRFPMLPTFMEEKAWAMRSREMIRMLEQDGWYLVGIRGSHHQYKHSVKPGRVTVKHPESDLPKGTINSILKQAGLK
jgi:predicted RNA binding protein YcfA (HicA-like mRNA interferase family)